jgi:predicted polyphosphate/ATP-dependent NAD kinase
MIAEYAGKDTVRMVVGTDERLIESMKRMQKNNKLLDEKIKVLLPELDLAISDHRFILLLDYARPDLATGYSMSIRTKRRNLRLHNKKLSIDDANEIFEFFRALATAKQVV